MKTTLILIPVIILGAFIARGRNESQAPSRPASSSEPAVAAPQTDAIIEEQRREIADLRRQLEAKPPAEANAPAPVDSARKAAEIYAMVLKAKTRKVKDSEAQMEMLARMLELEPSMTPFLAAKFKAATDPVEREVALVLAMMAGGVEGARFADELIKQADLPETERRMLLRSLAGYSDMPMRITVGDDLARTGEMLLSSVKPEERAAGAGILGRRGTAAACEILKPLVQNDAAVEVQVAAILGLGKSGDRGALDFLKAMRVPGQTQRVANALEISIGKLEAKLVKAD